MTTTLIVEANSYSMTQGSAPSAGQISSALSSIRLPAGSEGRWVGPLPRITRTVGAAGGIVGGGTTFVSWPYQFPDNDAPRLAVLSANLKRAVENALEPLAPSSPADLLNTSTDHPRHFVVTVNLFNQTINGRYDWWQSGHAAQTQTRDRFPGIVGSATNPDENPSGPTVVGVNVPQGNAAALATYKPYLYLGAGAVALYFLWPVLTGARTAVKRKNPTVLKFPSKKQKSRIVEVLYPSSLHPEWDNKMDAIALRYGAEEEYGSGMGPEGRDIWFKFDSDVKAAKFIHDVNEKFRSYVKQGKVSTRYITVRE